MKEETKKQFSAPQMTASDGKYDEHEIHDLKAVRFRSWNKNIDFQNNEIEQTMKLQKSWHMYCKILTYTAFFITTCFIFILGKARLSYRDYPYFPYVVVSSFFVQIIGLGYIIVKHLFSRNTKTKKSCHHSSRKKRYTKKR